MALITDLPAASSLATTDLLIKDTGSATQKIAISDAYATASQPGLVSTGAQTIAGIKTFSSGVIEIKNSAANNYIDFIPNGTTVGGRVTATTASDNNRILFSEWHRSGGVNSSTYRDAYYLPRSGTDNASHDYDILTTTLMKQLTSGGVSFNIPNGSRCIVFVGGGNANYWGIYFIWADSSGAVGSSAYKASSNTTLTTSTNTATFASSTGNMWAFAIPIGGNMIS